MNIIAGHLNIDNDALLKRCNEVLLNKNNYSSTTDLFMNIIQNHVQGQNNASICPHTWIEFNTISVVLAELSNNTVPRNSWFNISNYGSIMNPHNHPLASHSVFVYYVRQLSEHPPIEFKIEGVWKPYPCVTGDWLYFPKNLIHRVGFSHSHEDRVSISVNL